MTQKREWIAKVVARATARPVCEALLEALNTSSGFCESNRIRPVFALPDAHSRTFLPWSSWRVWYPTLKQLGIPRVGVHVLRHSAAARMIAAGASPKAVQKVLGHRSVAFTLTVYGHMFDDDLDDLASRLDVSARVQRVSKLDERRRAESGK